MSSTRLSLLGTCPVLALQVPCPGKPLSLRQTRMVTLLKHIAKLLYLLYKWKFGS